MARTKKEGKSDQGLNGVWLLNSKGEPEIIAFTDTESLLKAIVINYGDDSDIRLVEKSVYGEYVISTAFVSALSSDNPAQPWETMIFNDTKARILARYASREEAIRGHAAAIAQVELLKEKIFDDLELVF